MQPLPTDFKGTERFEVQRELGRGGMGVVYEVFDADRQQLVALKTLLRMRPDELFRFKKEFRTLADVVHPNLVLLHELFSENDQWFFTMELLKGTSFLRHTCGPQLSTEAVSKTVTATKTPMGAPTIPDATEATVREGLGSIPLSGNSKPEALRRYEPGNPDLVRPALAQLIEALRALHNLGHLHRDVKSSNVMVTHEGRVVLLDFGIVADVEDTQNKKFRERAGTPSYTAPEQARLGLASPASDLYSVGVLLYQALTGRLPHDGRTFQNIARWTHDFVSPAEMVHGTPSELSDLCCRLLDPEPTARPSIADILSVLTQRKERRKQRATSVGGARVDGPLVARDDHLARLHGALARAVGGEGNTVLIHGRSGMGKTALVDAFLADCETSGVVTLRGRCYESESVPFKALDSLMDSLCRYVLERPWSQIPELLPGDLVALGDAFPVMRRIEEVAAACAKPREKDGPQTEPALRTAAALRELVENIARSCPLVLFVDDLQWGDRDSLPLFADLVLSKNLPALILGTFREEERDASEFLGELLPTVEDDERVTQLQVAALAPEQVLDLVNATPASDQLPQDIVRRIAEESHGSPYFVQELVRFGLNQPASLRSGSLSLEEVILSRSRELSEEAQHLLQVVAVAGRQLPQEVAQHASQLTDVRAFAELRAAHLIRTTGRRGDDLVEPYHDRVGEAVRTELGTNGRARLHGRLAISLEGRDDANEEHLHALARHYYLADSPDLSRAYETNYAAGRRAAESLAFEQAHQFMLQAQTLAKRADLPADAAFDRLLGEMCARTGRVDDAVAHFRKVLKYEKSPINRAAVRGAMAKIHLGQLDTASSRREVTIGLRELGHSPPKASIGSIAKTLWQWISAGVITRLNRPHVQGRVREKIRTLIDLQMHAGLTSYFDMDRISIAQYGLRVLLPAAQTGPSSATMQAHVLMAAMCATLGRRKACERYLRMAIDWAETQGDPVATARVKLYVAVSSHMLGRTQVAEEQMIDCLADGQWLENVDFLTAIADLTWNLLMRGYAERGWSRISQGLDRADVARTRLATEGHTYRCYAGPVLAMLGRADDGQRHMNQFREFIDRHATDKWRWGQYLSHQTLLYSETGEIGDAAEEAIAAHQKMRFSPAKVPQQLRQFYVAQAKIRLLQFERAPDADKDHRKRVLKKSLAELKKASVHPTIRAHRHVIEARFQRLLGREKAMYALLEKAATLADETDNRLVSFEATVERLRAERADDENAARSGAREALAIAEEYGWKPRAESLTREFELGSG